MSIISVMPKLINQYFICSNILIYFDVFSYFNILTPRFISERLHV